MFVAVLAATAHGGAARADPPAGGPQAAPPDVYNPTVGGPYGPPWAQGVYLETAMGMLFPVGGDRKPAYTVSFDWAVVRGGYALDFEAWRLGVEAEAAYAFLSSRHGEGTVSPGLFRFTPGVRAFLPWPSLPRLTVEPAFGFGVYSHTMCDERRGVGCFSAASRTDVGLRLGVGAMYRVWRMLAAGGELRADMIPAGELHTMSLLATFGGRFF